MSGRLNAATPASPGDDFSFAPMQMPPPPPYVGFEHGGGGQRGARHGKARPRNQQRPAHRPTRFHCPSPQRPVASCFRWASVFFGLFKLQAGRYAYLYIYIIDYALLGIQIWPYQPLISSL